MRRPALCSPKLVQAAIKQLETLVKEDERRLKKEEQEKEEEKKMAPAHATKEEKTDREDGKGPRG